MSVVIPVVTRSPRHSRRPNRGNSVASQATTVSGLPSTAAPDPVSVRLSLIVSVTGWVGKSIVCQSADGSPATQAPWMALSANRDGAPTACQSRYRWSTISIDGRGAPTNGRIVSAVYAGPAGTSAAISNPNSASAQRTVKFDPRRTAGLLYVE